MASSRLSDSSAAWRLRLMLAASAMLLLASVALMAGATYAWFSDTVVNEGNSIRAAGNFPDPAPVLDEPDAASDDPQADGSEAPDEGPQGIDDQQSEGELPPDSEVPEPEEAPSADEGGGALQQEAEGLTRSAAGG